MSHWFPTGLADLRRKGEILDRYCEEIGRDPSTISRTIGSPVILVEDEQSGRALLERLPPERRAAMSVATPLHAAEILGEYVSAGFRGFTFTNATMRTPEAVALAAEMIRLFGE